MMPKSMKMRKGKVTLVRERADRERINVKVRTEYDPTSPSEIECFEDPEEWEKFKENKREEDLMIAKQRGQIAADGLNREKWMESKITKAEEDMRESVALVEKLRAAAVVRKIKSSVQIIDVGLEDQKGTQKANTNVLKDSGNVRKHGSVTFKKKYYEPPKQPTRIITSQLKPTSQQLKTGQGHPRTNVESSEKSKVVPKRTVELVPSSDTNRHVASSSTGRHVDLSKLSTDRHVDLSTILEATETVDSTSASSLIDEVDLIPVRGPSSRDDELSPINIDRLSSNVRTFSNASHRAVVPRREVSSTARIASSRSSPTSFTSEASSDLFSDSLDINSVAIILDRIKLHRKKLEEEKENSESGFESIFTRVEAQSRGAKNQNQSLGAKNENQQPKEKFHIDEQFIRKVLEFETSSPLLSSGSQKSGSSTNNSATSSDKPNKERKKILKKFRHAAKETGSSVSSDYDNPREAKSQKPPKPILSSQVFSPRTDITDFNHKPTDEKKTFENFENIDRIPKTSNKPTAKLSSEDDSKMRYYIEKLLTMRHEDVENLSVSSVQSTTQGSEMETTQIHPFKHTDLSRISTKHISDLSSSTNQSSERRPLHSSLKSPNSLSSSSESGKKVRFEVEDSRRRQTHVKSFEMNLESSLDATMYKSLSRKEDDSPDYSNVISSLSAGPRAGPIAGPRAGPRAGPSVGPRAGPSDIPDTSNLSCQEILRIFAEKRSCLENQIESLEKDLKSSQEEQGSQGQEHIESEVTSSCGSFTNGGSSTADGSLTNGDSLTAGGSLTNVTSFTSSSMSTVTASQLTTKKIMMNLLHSKEMDVSQVTWTQQAASTTAINQIKMASIENKLTHTETRMTTTENSKQVGWDSFDVSCFSDPGTDSESGSKISRIDLSSDVSSFY